MDKPGKFWHFSDMTAIPAWQLYGEETPFPDLLHIESIPARAAGLEWRIEPHRHLHLHQLFLLTAGDIRMTIDGVRHPVVPPALVNIPPGQVHGFRFSGGTDGFVMTLPVAVFADLFGTAAETATPASRAFVVPAGPELVALFAAVSRDHASPQPYRSTLLRAGAMRVLALAVQAAPALALPTPDPRLARFAVLVAQHLRDRWQVADYAAALAVSARHLGRLCRHATGQSLQAHITAAAMHEACRLLVYTRMPVQQVAFHLGYDDPSYFSRVFQRVMKTSPKDYRTRFEG